MTARPARQRRLLALAAWGVVVAFVCGCGTAGSHTAAGRSETGRTEARAAGGGHGVAGPPSAVRLLRLPIEDYMPSPKQIAEETRARSLLFRACLARFGITTVYPIDSGRQRGPATMTELRYGSTDMARAARYGYWWPGDDRRQPAVPRPGRAERDVSAGAVTRFHGRPVPPGGCGGEIARTLDGPDATPATYMEAFRAANEMEMASFHDSRGIPQVQAAETAWAACMKGTGYSLPADVFSATNGLHLPDVRPRPAPGSPEIKMAVADTACVNRSGVAAIWNSAEIAYERETIARDPQRWSRVKEVIDRHFGNVARVLAAHRREGA